MTTLFANRNYTKLKIGANSADTKIWNLPEEQKKLIRVLKEENLLVWTLKI